MRVAAEQWRRVPIIWSAGGYGSWIEQIGCGRLCGALGSDESADVDEVVSDDSESDPALHTVVATRFRPE
jgi:hypothetical protein